MGELVYVGQCVGFYWAFGGPFTPYAMTMAFFMFGMTYPYRRLWSGGIQ